MASQMVGHDRVITHTHVHTHTYRKYSPVFSDSESHAMPRGTLEGYSSWGRKESDTIN